jgi:hypothetical protein
MQLPTKFIRLFVSQKYSMANETVESNIKDQHKEMKEKEGDYRLSKLGQRTMYRSQTTNKEIMRVRALRNQSSGNIHLTCVQSRPKTSNYTVLTIPGTMKDQVMSTHGTSKVSASFTLHLGFDSDTVSCLKQLFMNP